MTENQVELPGNRTTKSVSPFRIDPTLHQILYKPQSRSAVEVPVELEALPEPPYPNHPDPQPMTKKAYHHLNAWRTWKSLGAPYFKSLRHKGELGLSSPISSLSGNATSIATTAGPTTTASRA